MFGENKYGFCLIVGGISLTICFLHSFRFAICFHCGKVLCLNWIPKVTDETSFITLGTEHHINKHHLIWLSPEALIYIILTTLILILSGYCRNLCGPMSRRLSPVLLEFPPFTFFWQFKQNYPSAWFEKKLLLWNEAEIIAKFVHYIE